MFFSLPEHVRNMALADYNGDTTVGPMLADALMELGLEKCANHYVPGKEIHSPICCPLSGALGGMDMGLADDTNCLKELNLYQERTQFREDAKEDTKSTKRTKRHK